MFRSKYFFDLKYSFDDIFHEILISYLKLNACFDRYHYYRNVGSLSYMLTYVVSVKRENQIKRGNQTKNLVSKRTEKQTVPINVVFIDDFINTKQTKAFPAIQEVDKIKNFDKGEGGRI